MEHYWWAKLSVVWSLCQTISYSEQDSGGARQFDKY